MKIRILITSVGSLVGQNILDCLDTRRDLVTLIGLNSEAQNQRLFRCDKAYLVPPVQEKEAFSAAFERIFSEEKPDLVLAGRDTDVVFLAKYKQGHPEVGNIIPSGIPQLAEMMLDKYECSVFAARHRLPFAATFLYRGPRDRKALKGFAETYGFPLVVKPRTGFASIGVYFLLNPQHVTAWIDRKTELLFQEYLGDSSALQGYGRLPDLGIPLCFQVPERNHFAAQVVISPTGRPIRSILTKHVMIGGRAETLEIFNNVEAENLVKAWVEILGKEGWTGFLNLQFKQDRLGSWKMYELNPRMVGASSARLIIGYDEIGMLMKAFFPVLDFPDLSLPVLRNGIVLKSLTDHYLDKQEVDKLEGQGTWSSGTGHQDVQPAMEA